MSKGKFSSLIKDVVNNLDNQDYKTTVSNRRYDLKNAEKCLLEIIVKKISQNESRELFSSLIKPDVDMLIKSTGRGKNKRINILNILNNIELSVFDGV